MARDSFKLDLLGSEELKKKIRQLPHVALKAAAASMYRTAEEIMADSKDNYVPIDTGNLKSTGHVSLVKESDSEVSVQLKYGGPAAQYAIPVHEINKNYRNGKQWKYLETPLKAHSKDVIKNLEKDLDKAFSTL